MYKRQNLIRAVEELQKVENTMADALMKMQGHIESEKAFDLTDDKNLRMIKSIFELEGRRNTIVVILKYYMAQAKLITEQAKAIEDG